MLLLVRNKIRVVLMRYGYQPWCEGIHDGKVDKNDFCSERIHWWVTFNRNIFTLMSNDINMSFGSNFSIHRIQGTIYLFCWTNKIQCVENIW